jgi:transcriptional regulator
MANTLKVAKVASVLELHAQGWSQRRIARELGVSRGAVERQLLSGCIRRQNWDVRRAMNDIQWKDVTFKTLAMTVIMWLPRIRLPLSRCLLSAGPSSQR